jgi:FkbM family methyltransferase
LAAHILGPEGTLVAVEPSPREQISLRHNLAANGHRAVRVRTEALGSADGTATLRATDAAHAGHNTLGAPIYASTKVIDEIQVQVTTFDHLVQDEVLKRVDVVKIDVEGAEQLVLEGAVASLRRFRPIVMLELQDPSLAGLGSSVSSVVSFLESLDYTVLKYSESSGKPQLPGSKRLGEGNTTVDGNVVACPSERIGDLV